MRLSPLQPPARVYLCSFPLFRPSNLGYIGRGVLLSRGNHPPFTRFDPAGKSFTTRPPTVGSRSRAHGDVGGTVLPLPVLTPLVHPLPQEEHPLPQESPLLGHDPGPTRYIVSAIMLVPPFSTLKPGIYRAWVTVEEGEPPSRYLSRTRCHIFHHWTFHSWVHVWTPPAPHVRLLAIPSRTRTWAKVQRQSLISRYTSMVYSRTDIHIYLCLCTYINTLCMLNVYKLELLSVRLSHIHINVFIYVFVYIRVYILYIHI